MKNWIVIVLLIAGTAWGLQHYQPWKKFQNANPDTQLRPTTASVQRRNIEFSITAAGDIGPAEQVSVRPEVNGRIATLNVDIGDRIKKGDVLFTLDDKDLQIERASRLTEIERAQLELDRAKRNYERSQELFTETLISQELFEDTKTNFELAKNALARSQKDLNLLDDRLTKTKIIAPFDCTVLTRPISVGQAVSGSGGFNSGTEILTIADLSHMIINAHINQADVTRLSQGQTVDVQVESVPGLKLVGTVDRIAPQTTIKSNIKGYATRITLKTLDSRVLPGMTANISIPVSSASDALAAPLAAIFTEQGERFAYVRSGEQWERRTVTVGVYDYDFVEVLTGLNDGDTVALEVPAGIDVSQTNAPAGPTSSLTPGKRPASASATNTPPTAQARTNSTQAASSKRAS